MKLKKIFTGGISPHWRAHHSSGMRFLLLSFGLLPVFVLSFVFRFAETSRLLFLSVAFGFLSDYISNLLFQKKFGFDSYTLLTSLIFSSLIPFGTPLWMVALGMLFAVLIGKECFGGWGNFIFHPAFLAYASVLIFLSENATPFREAKVGLRLFHHYLIEPQAASVSGISSLAVLVGGAYLIWQRLTPWKASASFLLTILVLSHMAGQGAVKTVFSGEVLIAAFFAISDSTSPIGSFGKILSSIGTAVFIVCMNGWLTSTEAVAFSVLMMNAVTPLIDRYLPFGLVRVRR